MNIVFTARKSSAVFHAIKGNFTGPRDLNLILGKGTRVEVFLIGSEGLKLAKEFSIYGEIACLERFRAPGADTDILLLTTTQYQLLTLSLTTGPSSPSGALPQVSVVSESLISLNDRHSRPAEVGQIVISDPEAKVVCAHLYQGMLKFLPVNQPSALRVSGSTRSTTKVSTRNNNLNTGTFSDQFNIPIEEVAVMSMAFLYGYPKPTLVMLYQDTKETRHVKTYEIDLIGSEKKDSGWITSDLGNASMVRAVPTPIGGFLVIGDDAISYFNPLLKTVPISITISPTIVRTCGQVDEMGNRYLLGDHRGMMWILVLILGAPDAHGYANVQDLKLEYLGTTSIPEALVYLDNEHVFVGSHLGDSQLVLLHTDPDPQGEYLDIVETFTNIAPVVDFDVVDLEGQGQGQIVACSGAFEDGSLRVVRNGVGINDKAILELPGIKQLWSLKSSNDSSSTDTLVMSFISSTRVIRITPDAEMAQEEYQGFSTDEPTLFCGNTKDNLILQVTPSFVRLLGAPDHIQAGLVAEWIPPTGQSISVASMSGTQCVVAVGGRTIVYLDIGSESITKLGTMDFENEIACLDVSADSVGAKAPVCAIGLWTDLKVLLVNLSTMQIISTHILSGDSLPRSLLLARFDDTPYLLVGLGDGQLFTFMLTHDVLSSKLDSPKKISLGTQPIMLSHIATAPGSASSHVFACSDRPTVIYSSNRKLMYSNVNLKQVSAICTCDCEAFPNSLAIVGSEEEGILRIGSIDEIQELHVQTHPLKESGRRIAYFAPKKCFGVLSTKVKIEGYDDTASVSSLSDANRPPELLLAEEQEVGFVRLHDDQTFDLLHSFELQPNEIPESITSIMFQGDPILYLAVGTGFSLPEDDEPKSGRILVFEVTETRQLRLVAEQHVSSSAFVVKEFHGKLLVGIKGRVVLYSWNGVDTLQSTPLTLECSYQGFIFVCQLATRGDFILVGDLLRSMSLLRYKSQEKVIVEIARDVNMNWMLAVEALDDDTFIGADNSNNLFTLTKNSETTNDDEAKRLQWAGGWHLGEQINRFKHGSLVMTALDGDAPAIPKLLFGTVSGTIGVVATLTAKNYEILRRLERNLECVIKGVGGLDHRLWRSFQNEARLMPPEGYIDGDLIESFLDLTPDEVQMVLDGEGTSDDPDKKEKIREPLPVLMKLVEDLMRLH